MTADPTPEALAVMDALIAALAGLTDEPDEIVMQESLLRAEGALVLDRFRAAGVEAERECCVTVAVNYADNHAEDHSNPTVAHNTAMNIASAIRSGETP